MRITRIETVRHADFPNLLHVEIHAGEQSGLGEAFYAAAAVETYLHEVVAPLLLGQDPRRITAHHVALQHYVGYASSGVESRARSAVDVALWDLAAKAAGVPLHDLLGGRTRASIGLYNTCAGPHYVRAEGQSTRAWGLGRGAADLQDLDRFLSDAGGLARELLDEGVTAMKIWPFDPHAERTGGTAISATDLQTALRPLGQIRDAVGDEMDVMVELHGLWSVPAARRIVGALQPYHPYWVEDPVRADAVGGLAEIAAAAHDAGTMLAAGETVTGLRGFVPLLQAAAIDVVTLDIGWCGGLTSALAIAALADAHGRVIAPHDCTGPVSLLVATQLAVAAPNALVQETVRAHLRTWYGEFVEGAPVIDGPSIAPPEAAGHGGALRQDLRDDPAVSVRASAA